MKTTRKEVRLNDNQIAQVALIMEKYTIVTEAKAIAKAIELATVNLPAVQFKCGGLETKNSELSRSVQAFTAFIHSFSHSLKTMDKFCDEYPLSDPSLFQD